jgi:hypothetical protein
MVYSLSSAVRSDSMLQTRGMQKTEFKGRFDPNPERSAGAPLPATFAVRRVKPAGAANTRLTQYDFWQSGSDRGSGKQGEGGL